MQRVRHLSRVSAKVLWHVARRTKSANLDLCVWVGRAAPPFWKTGRAGAIWIVERTKSAQAVSLVFVAKFAREKHREPAEKLWGQNAVRMTRNALRGAVWQGYARHPQRKAIAGRTETAWRPKPALTQIPVLAKRSALLRIKRESVWMRSRCSRGHFLRSELKCFRFDGCQSFIMGRH